LLLKDRVEASEDGRVVRGAERARRVVCHLRGQWGESSFAASSCVHNDRSLSFVP
jgi:hypothetical protein